MSHFIYYLPAQNLTAAKLPQSLLDAMPTPGLPGNRIEKGPDGKEGAIFAGKRNKETIDAARLKYAPKEQTWMQGPEYWVGYWNDDEPTAETLARPRMVNGYSVELEGGERWTVPLARVAAGGTMLPERLAMDADNNLRRTPLEQYSDLCAAAEAAFETIVAVFDRGEIPKVDERELFHIAVQALQTNYYVGAAELSLLGVITTANLLTIVQYLADLPGYIALRDAAAEDETEKNAEAPMPE